MKFKLGIAVFVSCAVLSCGGSSSDWGKHASIKSKYGQLVTSSTLRWQDISNGADANLSDAVPSGTGNPSRVVCRSEHHGTLLIGQTTKEGGHCTVGFVNKLFLKHKYEVLMNKDHGAKLEWRTYNKYGGVPEGSVAGVDDTSSSSSNTVFIGRHLMSSTGQWEPGAVEVPRGSPYSAFGVMRVFDPETGNMDELSTGDVLVEIEPVRYELEIRQETDDSVSRRPQKTTRQDVVLAKSSLFRFEEGRDVEARLQKVLTYKYEKSEYYGQVSGMIRALPTQVRLPNGQVQSLRWGLPEVSSQQETLMVGHALKHHTAVDVSIVGVRITEESPYKATLTSIFQDGTQRQRKIEGVSQRKYLNNIRPEYSRVYQIKESVFVSNAQSTGTMDIPSNSFSSDNSSSTTINRSHRGSADSYNAKDTITVQGMSDIRNQQNHMVDQNLEIRKRERMLADENKQQLLMSVQSGCGACATFFSRYTSIVAAAFSVIVFRNFHVLN